MKLVRYLQSFFHVVSGGMSVVKYEAGKFYAECEETLRHIEHGIAELVDAPDDAAKAAANAQKAEAAAAKAADAAEQAKDAADAAAAAAEIGAQSDAGEKA